MWTSSGTRSGYQAVPYLDIVLRTDTPLHGVQLHLRRHRHVRLAEHDGRCCRLNGLRRQCFVFSGNAFTPCMDGVTPRTRQYYDLYTTYTKQAIGIFSSVGAHVFLVGTPVDESSARWVGPTQRHLPAVGPGEPPHGDLRGRRRFRRNGHGWLHLGPALHAASSRAVATTGPTWCARPTASTFAQTESPADQGASLDRATSIPRELSDSRSRW